MKLSIAKKLGIGFFFVSILIVLVGYLGLHGIYRVRDINQTMEKTDHALLGLGELRSIAAHQIDHGMHFLFLGDKKDVLKFGEAGKTFRNKLHLLQSEVPELQDPLNDIASAHHGLERDFWRIEEEYRKGGGVGLSKKGRLHEMWHPREEELLAIIKAANASLIEQHLEANRLASKSLRNTVAMTTGLALLMFLVAGSSGFYISKKISSSIINLKDAAVKIGKGDLDTRITVPTGDEVETLAEEFNRMAERLSESYATLEERVRERTRDLERESSRLEMLFSGISATGTAVAVISMDHRVLLMNEHATKVFGASSSEMHCYQLLHGLSEPCSNCMLERVFKTGETMKLDNVDIHGRMFNIWVAPMKDADGNVSCIEVFQDITNLKRMEAKFIRSERYKTIADISRGIAHNFNNLLATVKGNVQLLLMNPSLISEEETKSSLDEIHERANEMAQLVSDMQHFPKDDGVFSDEKTSIIPVLELAVKILRPVWKDEMRKKGIDLDIVFESVDVPHARGSRQDYQTVFKNILLNAIEAMTCSGKIRVSTSLVTEGNGDFVRVAIRDEGSGMDEATCFRAPEPLFSTKSTVGVGMGLTVASGIVRDLGGTLTIESKPEKGTTVVVTVPIADSASLPERVIYEKEDKETADKKKTCQILVAEDEGPVRNLLTRLLVKLGHQVTGAADGVEALKIAKDKSFDLAFVDWSMPLMNGLEFMQKLHETCPGMPVVMVTGWSDGENLESLSEGGIDYVITKPFDMEKIGEAIERLV